MLSQLYAIPTEEPRETPNEAAMLPMARMVRDEWVTTFFQGSHEKDNWTQEDSAKREEYLSLMLKEPAVSTAFWSLIASVMSLPLKVHAADADNPREVYWANFARDAISSVSGGVPRLVANTAAGGLLFGFGLCEMVFDYPERGKWRKNLVLTEYAPLDSRYIRFDLDPFKRVRGVRGLKANGGQVFDPDRFAIFSHQSLFGSPFGISKFRAAYRAAKMMESAVKLRIILLQNFTGPFLVLKSGGATTRETAMRVLSEARALGYMVCDRQDEAEVLNMAAGSDSEFQTAIDDLRKEMYTAIRWGYLPFTEAQSGVQVGNSEVQKSMTQLGEWMLATEIAQVFSDQIVKPLIRANCPDDEIGFPTVSLGGQNSTDKQAVANIFESAKRLGLTLSKRQVQRALDIEEPNGPDDEIRDPVQAGPGGNPFIGQPGIDPTAGGMAGGDAGPGGPPAAGPDGSPVPGPPAGPTEQPQPNEKIDLSSISQGIGQVTPAEMDKAALVAALDLRARAVSIGRPGQFQRAIDALQGMIGNHPAMRAAIMRGGQSAPPKPDQSFGWMADRSKSGGVKAVGTGEHSGRTLYGTDAQRVLSPQQPAAAKQPDPTSGSKAAEPAKQERQPAAAKPEATQKAEAETRNYQSLGKQVGQMTIEQVQTQRQKLAPTPAVEEMAGRLAGHALEQTGENLTGGKATEALHGHLNAAQGLSDEQRSLYGSAIDRVTHAMPDAAHERIAAHLKGGATFHADTASIADGVKADVLSIARADRHPAIEERFKGMAGEKFGGGYVIGKGTIHIDGGKDGASPHEVYAHTLGHVLDGPKQELSNSDQWWDAFTSEIAMQPDGSRPLGRHAASEPGEGFAEFSRLLYGSDVPHGEIAKRFPRATAVFRKNGLLPEGFDHEGTVGPDVGANRPAHGRSTAAMALYGKGRDDRPGAFALPERFAGKVEVHPDGSHIDMLAGKAAENPAPSKDSPLAQQFKAAHVGGDDLAMHDLIAESLQGKHGDGTKEAVNAALDEHYAGGAKGGADAKHAGILKALEERGDADESDLPVSRSKLSAKDDPFADDDEFNERKGVTGADLLSKLDAVGDDGKPLVRGKAKGGSDSLHHLVAKSGGIDPESVGFLAHFGSVNEAVEQGIPRTAFRKGGRDPQELAQELHNEGHIAIPGQASGDDRDAAPDVDGTAHLFEQLMGGAKSLHSAGDQYAAAEAESLKRDQEAAGYKEPKTPKPAGSVRGGTITLGSLKAGEETAKTGGEPGERKAGGSGMKPATREEPDGLKVKNLNVKLKTGGEKKTESAESVLDRIKASPNQPAGRDWDEYAKEHGVTGDFTHADVPTEQLKGELEAGQLAPGNAINPETVAAKVESGDRNPVVIATQPDGSAKVLDGNHSLHAAIASGDESVQAITNHPTHTSDDSDNPPEIPDTSKADPYATDDHEARVERWQALGHDDEYAETLAKTPWNALSEKQRGEYGQAADDAPAKVLDARTDPNPGEAIPAAKTGIADDGSLHLEGVQISGAGEKLRTAREKLVEHIAGMKHEDRVKLGERLGATSQFGRPAAGSANDIADAVMGADAEEAKPTGKKAFIVPTRDRGYVAVPQGGSAKVAEVSNAPLPDNARDTRAGTVESAEAMAREHFAAGKPGDELLDNLEDHLTQKERAAFEKKHDVTFFEQDRNADLAKIYKNLGSPNPQPETAKFPDNPNDHWTEPGRAAIWEKAGYTPPVAAKMAKMRWQYVSPEERAKFEQASKESGAAPVESNSDAQPTNTIVGDGSNPKVPNGRLEATGDGSDRGRLPAGERLGDDVGSAPSAIFPGSGSGTEPEGDLSRVSAGSDEQLAQRVFGDDRSGDGAANGPRVGPESVIADPAGRSRPARGLGAGSRDVRPDGSNGAILEQSDVEKSLAKPSTPENPTGAGTANFQYDSSDFFAHGLKSKFAANVAAMRTLQSIKAEGRTTATPEEQQILSRFVGWGQFPALFNYADHSWNKEREVFRDLVGGHGTPEWDSAQRSTTNAHYTHPDVVKAHWRIAQRLGFDGGRYLETSAGIGYYLGMMPPELAGKTKTTAIEREKTTGEMLKHLYPNAVVKVQGFEDHKPPKDFYDLIASNVPFGETKVHDPEYNKHRANIHDYFFLKSATHLRPGGLMMHITSTGTLNKPDSKIRAELAKTCDLVSAIRFPGDTHKENAGTSVVTDMLILRKRLPGEQPGNMDWLETTTVPDPAGGEPIPTNKHFVNNPHLVLGTPDRTGKMRQAGMPNVSKTDDYEQRLEAAIQSLPEGVFTKASKTVPQRAYTPIADDGKKHKNGAFVIQDGKLHVKEGDSLIPKATDPKTVEKVAGHMQIRDAVRGVINAQIEGGDADAARSVLNKAYDEFTKKHGPLNSPANKKAFSSDPDSPVLLAIEQYDGKGKKATKADIFTKNTVRSVKKADSAGSPEEALGISLHEHGHVNIGHIAKLTGKTPEEVGEGLVHKGLAFQDPSHGWKHASEYLSGNVRKKLALARSAAEVDPKFQANVAALEKVQPSDVNHEDIEVKLGASWVPPSDYARFAADLLDGDPEHFKIVHNPHSGAWFADFTSKGQSALRARRGNKELYGTARKEFMDLLEPALNNQTVTVYDKDLDGNQIVNVDETGNANAKIQEVKDKFKEWVWTDDERRERLHRHYNDNFNNTVPMKYDGSHQPFPGMNPHIDLRPHQKDFVWQTVTTGKGLAAHEVGTGKTYTMAAAAMELRRLGLAKKPAIACLKANIDQVAKETQELYPHARILAVDKFDASNRKKIISQMATGDYDMVILTHDNLNMLQMKPETTARFIKEELDELEAAKLSAEAEGGNKKGNRIVKALEKAKENLEAKLKEATDSAKKDDAVFFEETGIDHLFVDEAHKFKSLPVYTKQDRVKGIPSSRSDRATNMLMRTRWLMEQNGGRGVTFATGTPVANTMAELFNMQRYLQPEELKERGIHTFDSWASTFGDIATKMEFSTTGEYKPVSRFARFVNIPELMQTARQIMDVQRATGLTDKSGKSTIKRPNRKDHVVEAPITPEMKMHMASLRDRAAAVKNNKDSKDNMLVIGTDGKKAAIDMRLVDPNAPDNPNSKVNQAIKNVLQIQKDNPGKTQMIFSDVGVHPMKHGFHLYADIIDKLEKGGIPREKIVNFAELDTKAKKDAGIMALKSGKALVGIGGTDRMGTGVNAQDHLIALHHLDIPYQPAEVEQRDGRGWRQGNTNKDVNIYRYVAHGSLDQTFWQIIDNKSRFIKQVLTPGTTAPRLAKDEDTEELTPEQLMAAASGDPKILEKVQTDEDIRNLSAAEKRHAGEQIKFRESIARGERSIPAMKERHENLKKDAEHAEKTPKFSLKLEGGASFDNREQANEALAAAFEKAPDPYGHGVRLGEVRGMGVYKVGGAMHVRGPSGESYPTGFTVGSIEHNIRNLGTEAEKQAAEIERTKSEIEKIRGKVGQSFPKAAELESKRARAKELENYLRGDFIPEGYSAGQSIEMADGRKVKILGSIPNKQIKVSDGKNEFYIGHDDLPEIKK